MMGQQTHILIVEDHVYLAQLLEGMLAADPSTFTFSSAETFRKAVKCLNTEKIDLILLDLNLPDSSGLNTLETIRAENFGVPIVVISGMDDKEIATQAVEKGAQSYIIKGQINCDLLFRTIHHALDRHRQERI